MENVFHFLNIICILTLIGERHFYMTILIYGITNSPKICVSLIKIRRQVPKTTNEMDHTIHQDICKVLEIKTKANMSLKLFF